MSKVNFKSYAAPKVKERLPTQLEVVAAQYGPYLTIEQFAECVNIKRTLAYGLVKGGALKVSRTRGNRGSYRISATEVIRYMENKAK